MKSITLPIWETIPEIAERTGKDEEVVLMMVRAEFLARKAELRFTGEVRDRKTVEYRRKGK